MAKTTNTEINEAIKLSVEIAKSYASSGQANPEIIPELIEKLYRKLMSLYEGKYWHLFLWSIAHWVKLGAKTIPKRNKIAGRYERYEKP
jgi:hypothetical protein